MSLKLTRFTRCLLPRGNNKTSSKEDCETRLGTVWEKQKPAERHRRGLDQFRHLGNSSAFRATTSCAVPYFCELSLGWNGVGFGDEAYLLLKVIPHSLFKLGVLFLWLTLPHPYSLLKEGRTGTQTGQDDAEAMKGCCLLACFP